MAARTASTLHTPLKDVLRMEWSDFLLWWNEADAIHGETFGLLNKSLAGET